MKIFSSGIMAILRSLECLHAASDGPEAMREGEGLRFEVVADDLPLPCVEWIVAGFPVKVIMLRIETGVVEVVLVFSCCPAMFHARCGLEHSSSVRDAPSYSLLCSPLGCCGLLRRRPSSMRPGALRRW